MIFRELDPRFQPQGGKVERCGRFLGNRQQPLANALSLRFGQNGEFADIETIGLRPQEEAADQLFAVDGDMPLPLRRNCLPACVPSGTLTRDLVPSSVATSKVPPRAAVVIEIGTAQ